MLALIAATPAVLLASYGPSRAEIVNLKADLTAAKNPPDEKLTGHRLLILTGPATRRISTDQPGKDGSIKVRVIVNHSPIEGSAILTKPTAKALDNDLLNGKFYINLHTAVYPRGEIRGQIAKAL